MICTSHTCSQLHFLEISLQSGHNWRIYVHVHWMRRHKRLHLLHCSLGGTTGTGSLSRCWHTPTYERKLWFWLYIKADDEWHISGWYIYIYIYIAGSAWLVYAHLKGIACMHAWCMIDVYVASLVLCVYIYCSSATALWLQCCRNAENQVIYDICHKSPTLGIV